MNEMNDLITINDLEVRYQEAKARLEALEVANDDEYRDACDLAKAVVAAEKLLASTEEVAKKKELYTEYKTYSTAESAIAGKLKEVKDIVRAHIGSYAVRKSTEKTDAEAEKLIAAAILTGDESFLDMLVKDEKAVPAVPGISFAKVRDFRIDDPEEIPLEYMVPDEKRIRKLVQAGEAIPGVIVFEKTQVRVSA